MLIKVVPLELDLLKLPITSQGIRDSRVFLWPLEFDLSSIIQVNTNSFSIRKCMKPPPRETAQIVSQSERSAAHIHIYKMSPTHSVSLQRLLPSFFPNIGLSGPSLSCQLRNTIYNSVSLTASLP